MQITSQISSLWQEKRHFYLSKIDLSPLKLSSHLMAYHRLQNTHVNCAWARRRTMVSNSPNPPKIRRLDFKQIHMISVSGHCIPFIFRICQTVAGITISDEPEPSWRIFSSAQLGSWPFSLYLGIENWLKNKMKFQFPVEDQFSIIFYNEID